MEMEEQVRGEVDYQEVDDDEQHEHVQLELKPQELDDYPSGPHNLTMLTKYYGHVARMATDGVV
jgi:hypothetical protein